MNRIWETISAAPAEAWVGLIGVIAGSLLTVLTAWLTSRANRKQLKMQLEHEEMIHRQRVAKDRLEELYVLVSQWEQNIFLNCSSLTKVMQGKLDYDSFKEGVLRNKSENGNIERLEMIVGIYGGKFAEAHKYAVAALDKVSDIQNAARQAFKNNDSGELLIKPLQTSLANFALASTSLKEYIAKAARES